MTAAVGQALIGPVSHPLKGGSIPAAGKDKDADFSDMLHKPDKAGPADAKPREAIWEKRSQAPRVADSKATASAGISPAEPTAESEDDPGTKTKGSEDAPDGGPDREKESGPLKDRLPLLMALQDLHRLSSQPAGRFGESGRHATAGQGHASLGAVDLSGGDAEVSAEQSLKSAMQGSASSGQAASAAALTGSSADKAASNGRPGENVAPGRPQDLPPPAGLSIAQSRTSEAHGAPERRRVEPEPFIARAEPEQQKPLAGQATVVAHQSTPAPALPTSQTGAQLAGFIASDNGWRQVLSAPAALLRTNPSAALPAQSLKIELHPAELGTVTANLRLAGGQLSIEIRPETHDAHRKLSADSDAIVASLRTLGFDVDKVAVLQPAANASARSDSVGSQPGQTGRDQSGFQSGNSSGGNGGQQSGRSFDETRQDHARAASPGNHTGGDLFI